MAEKKKILYIVEAMGGGVFTYIVDEQFQRVEFSSCDALFLLVLTLILYLNLKRVIMQKKR